MIINVAKMFCHEASQEKCVVSRDAKFCAPARLVTEAVANLADLRNSQDCRTDECRYGKSYKAV